jgi:hypothetical protein
MSSASARPVSTMERRRAEAPRRATAEDTGADDFVANAYREACERLERRVLAHLPTPGGTLALAITDNRHTMISVKRGRNHRYQARVHHMFLDAPPVITRALARYIASNERESSRELGAYIDQNQGEIQKTRLREPVMQTAGVHCDLQEMFDRLDAQYFEGHIASLGVRITWGGRGASRRRRRVSMKMGSYAVEERLIRIHPSLDRDFVPRFFVEWIVFHEMLHAIHPMPVVDGRRQFHTPAFMHHERQFAEYVRARDWERKNLDRLLTF